MGNVAKGFTKLELSGSAITTGLIAAVKRADQAAINGLFVILQPVLLRLTKPESFPGHEALELVTTFLDNFLLALPKRIETPDELSRYVTAAFLNYLRNVARADKARTSAYSRAATDSSTNGESFVSECQSEYSISRSAGEAEEQPEGRSGLSGLVRELRQVMSDEEVFLAGILANRTPTRAIAEWLGIDHSTCRVRIHRLRVRLRRETAEYARSAAGIERREVERFLRRLGIASNTESSDE